MLSADQIKIMLRKRTKCEKILTVFLVILTVCLIGFISAFILKKNTLPSSTCTTETCENLGLAIFHSLDRRIDPCDDFYKYACGGWMKTHSIPDDKGMYDFMEILKEDVLEKVHDLLSNKNISSSSSAVENALKFFTSCMDTDKIEQRGNSPLLKLLNEFGGWPVIDTKWNCCSYDFLVALAKIQLHTGFGFILPISIGTDPMNTSRQILTLETHPFSLPVEVFLNQKTNTSEKKLASYKNFFTKLATLLGAKKENLSSDFDDIIQFETKLAEFTSPVELLNNTIQYNFTATYNKMSIHSLQRKYPKLDWLKYLKSVTDTPLASFDVMTENDLIIVKDLNYLKKLSDFLSNSDPQLSRKVSSYLGWRVVMSQLGYMPQNFSEVAQEYTRDSGYTQVLPDRWKMCTDATVDSFGDVMSFLYVKQYFPDEAKNEISKIVLDLRFQFEQTLVKNDWMDKPTKKAALAKLRAMKTNVGYPDWMYDLEAITESYMNGGKPNMTDDIFENSLALNSHSTSEIIKRLRRGSMTQQWPMEPVTINAGYRRYENDMIFPAAFLQKPVYSPAVPRFYNYAAIGAIIGHEITHGFDNEGRKRNAFGEMQNWWSNSSEHEFLKRAECFVDQYNSYGINGRLTLDENIADNGGLRQAYGAFLRWKNNTGQVLSLPHLEEFSIEQQFFLVYGSIWCANYKPEILNYTILNDVHAPSNNRVMGTISNLPEFYEAFHCVQNSLEDSKNHCTIW